MGKLFKSNRSRTTAVVNVEAFGGPWDGAYVQCHDITPGIIVLLHGARYELRPTHTGPFRFFYLGG